MQTLPVTILQRCSVSQLFEDGRLRLKSGRLDREATPSFSVTLVATDSGSPPLSASTTITFVVDDVNDNPPRWLFPTRGNVRVASRVGRRRSLHDVSSLIAGHGQSVGQVAAWNVRQPCCGRGS